jgi:predicted secreted protein
MERGKNIVLVSHCILNQNSVVLPLARAKGSYNALCRTIFDNDIGILQLPCPEITHLGLSRPPMTKEEYDTIAYRQLCKELILPILTQLLFYREAGYNLIGIIGIDQSPTCSLNNTGILMESLLELLDQHKINLRHIAVPTTYHESNNTSFSTELSQWIQEGINN